MAQLALNSKQSKTTKTTSFFANFEREPNLFERPINVKAAQSAMNRVITLQKVHNNILRMQATSAKYQNKKRKIGPQLKEGDKVYLITKNLRYRKKDRKRSRKLDQVKVGPFFIKAVKGSINYELDLPQDAKVFPVFHISLLELADPNTPIQDTFHYEAQEEDEYEVENILEKRGTKYLVKWKGYLDIESTWEHPET